MKIITVLILAAAFVFFSCGKSDTTTTDTKKQVTPGNQQTNTQQTNNQNQNTPSGSSNSFHVKNIGSAGAHNESTDFTWMEDGKEMKLSDYKGKVVLINFWATWCGPCKRELPSLSEISNEMKNKDFKLIGVSVDEQQAAVDNFLRATPLSYTVLHEPNELVMRYMEASGQRDNVIPQSYLIDKNGKIVETIIGGRSKEDFVKIINKYL